MHDQFFWTADVSAFSPFQRAVSAVAAWVVVSGLLFGAFATAGGLIA